MKISRIWPDVADISYCEIIINQVLEFSSSVFDAFCSFQALDLFILFDFKGKVQVKSPNRTKLVINHPDEGFISVCLLYRILTIGNTR